MKSVTRTAWGLAAFLLLFGVGHAGPKTEQFWNDLFKKYSGESLVCLLDNVTVDVEYTGEVARRDISDTERGGLAADRAASLALGSRYTTINRYSKQFAVLDEAGAAAMREYAVPYLAGQLITHHSLEIVDRQGNRVPASADRIQVRSAYPDAGEIYQRVKDLVFRLDDLPIPCVVGMHYTVEGEEAFGFQDRVFASRLPTYRMEMSYSFPQSYAMQNAWWPNALKSLRIQDPEQKSTATARGEVLQWIWRHKNLRPAVREPFAPPLGDVMPRIVFSPNFESNWSKLLEWYAEGVTQALTVGGSDRILRGPTREAIEQFEAAKKEARERDAAAESAASVAEGSVSTEGAEEEIAASTSAPLADEPLTQREEIAAILRYVQDRYEVLDLPLGRDGYFPNRPVDVFDLPRVAPKDLVGILVGMLRIAGIETDFAVVSTSEHGAVRTEFPALVQFDRALAVARSEGDVFFLDPTDKAAGIEDPAASIEGQTVLVVRAGDEPEWLPVPISSSSRNGWALEGELSRDESGAWKKTVEGIGRGEANRVFRERFYVGGSERGSEARRVWTGQNFPAGCTLGDWTDSRGLTNDEDYEFRGTIAYPEGLVEERGDTLILSAALFGRAVPIQYFAVGDARTLPIRLGFEERGEEKTRFRVPEGYAIVSLPGEQEYRKPFGKVHMTFSRYEGTIEYLMEYTLDETELPVEAAPLLLEMFDQFLANDGKKIILRKRSEEELVIGG
jgi:hypothetical protein